MKTNIPTNEEILSDFLHDFERLVVVIREYDYDSGSDIITIEPISDYDRDIGRIYEVAKDFVNKYENKQKNIELIKPDEEDYKLIEKTKNEETVSFDEAFNINKGENNEK